MIRLRITKHRDEGIGWCLDCDEMPKRERTRERVRTHVRRTGHTARYQTAITTTYSKPTEPQ